MTSSAKGLQGYVLKLSIIVFDIHYGLPVLWSLENGCHHALINIVVSTNFYNLNSQVSLLFNKGNEYRHILYKDPRCPWVIVLIRFPSDSVTKNHCMYKFVLRIEVTFNWMVIRVFLNCISMLKVVVMPLKMLKGSTTSQFSLWLRYFFQEWYQCWGAFAKVCVKVKSEYHWSSNISYSIYSYGNLTYYEDVYLAQSW